MHLCGPLCADTLQELQELLKHNAGICYNQPEQTNHRPGYFSILNMLGQHCPH